MLSNSLADLAEQVKVAADLSAAAERTSADQALKAGKLLVVAKEQCKHGEWLPFLTRAGIHERQARRLMQLHRSGLNGTHVSDLGGIGATLRWLSDRRLPSVGEILMVSLGPDRQTAIEEPFAFVWPIDGGYHVVMFDLNEAVPHTKWTDKPVVNEPAVWLSLYQALDFRFAEMVFDLGPHDINENDLRILCKATGRLWEELH